MVATHLTQLKATSHTQGSASSAAHDITTGHPRERNVQHQTTPLKNGHQEKKGKICWKDDDQEEEKETIFSRKIWCIIFGKTYDISYWTKHHLLTWEYYSMKACRIFHWD